MCSISPQRPYDNRVRTTISDPRKKSQWCSFRKKKKSQRYSKCFVALGLVPDGAHSVLKGTQRYALGLVPDGEHSVLKGTQRRLPNKTRPQSKTVKASGNVDNEGLTGRAREDHRFGFRRANIFRHYQADLGLLLAALGAQQRHHPKHFSFHSKIAAVVRGEWSPQPRVTQSHSIFNSNKQYISPTVALAHARSHRPCFGACGCPTCARG